MATRSGWVPAFLGALGILVGATIMVVLGPDNRFSTGPHAIETDTTAVVTAPGVISWSGVQVDVLAEVPVRKPVFVGIGNSVDVEDFVGTTRRLEITDFSRPWTISTREIEGTPNLPGAATSLDWWIDSADGLGGASISTRLPDQTVSIAVVSVGSSNLSGLTVTMAYGVKGGFGKGASMVLFGAALVLLGIFAGRGFGRVEDEDEGVEVEEVVYVYIDEDGVEHEISAEEAERLDVVEETVDVRDPEPSPMRDERPGPLSAAPRVEGVLTAADIAGGVEPSPPSEPEPGAERVVYVYIDDDGVEHEVSEDELAEFEVVDEEDQP